MPRHAAGLSRAKVETYTIPTDRPESDGTLQWSATTVIVVEIAAGGSTGLGYTYGHPACATLIAQTLAPLIEGRDPLDIPGAWAAMRHAIRNLGRPGISSMAIAAVDVALWDLKAKLVGLPLAKLLGMVRPCVEVYGSGGFTSYTDAELAEQLGGWAEQGVRAVKMKVGRDPGRDPERVRTARAAIGPATGLFVDGNGAYRRQQALRMADAFARYDVTWFEEPVSSDDLEGLAWLRQRVPAGMAVAAGEYGYDLPYFQRMLAAEAVDVQQADASRCAGISVFLEVGGLCAAFQRPMSAHTGPSLHLHASCALERLWNIEYFHDHTRIEHLLFDGVPRLRDGALWPDLSRPGLGIELKRRDARRWAA